MTASVVIVLVVVLLISLCEGQKLCTGCYTNTSAAFQCNGQNCEAFLWPNNTTPLGLNCKSSSSNCYYLDGPYDITNFRFIACNYSLSNCGSCTKKETCSTCYNGFVSYYYNIEEKYQSCKPCGDVIPGCQLCSSSTSCSQCEDGYLNRGFCYESDGVTVAGTSSQNNIQMGIEIGVLIVAVLAFLGFIMCAYGFNIWIKKQKYQPLA